MSHLLTRKSFWFLMLSGLLLAVSIGSLSAGLDHETLTHHLQMLGKIGVGVFILGHVVMAVVGLPATVLAVVGGAVFGLWWGTVWSVIGATLGAIAAFWLARYLLRDWIERRFGDHPLLKTTNHMIHHSGLTCVLTLRFTPISPFTLVNFVFGLTSIRLKPYVIGTLIGIIPGTLVYTWIGAAGHDALMGNGIASLAIALTVLAALSGLPLVVTRIRTSRR